MTKEDIQSAMQDRARGERTRVVFDLLMETIGADFKITQAEVFVKMKEILELEAKAIATLLPTQRMPEKSETAEEYVQSFQRESDGV